MALKIDRLIVRPWSTALDLGPARDAPRRAGWHVVLEAGGAWGIGDVAPWPGFGPGPAEVGAALARLDVSAGITAALVAALPSPVAHGVEQALLDLLARLRGVPLAALLAEPHAAAVASHRLVRDAAEARAAVEAGAPALKIKVGGPLEGDVARLGAIRDAAPGAPLRLDANGAWSRTEAARAVAALAAFAPQWIEQPLPAPDLDGLAALARTSAAPLAVDESVALFGERAFGCAEVAVIKPMFVGGLRRALALAHAARAAGRAVCVTHALDSAVGRLGALHLAAALEGPDGAAIHGLAGPPPTAPEGPRVPLPPGPGLGLAAHEEGR